MFNPIIGNVGFGIDGFTIKPTGLPEAFSLRFAVQNPGAADLAASQFQLMYSYNGAPYLPVTTVSPIVHANDSSSDPDGTVIQVPRLTPGPAQ